MAGISADTHAILWYVLKSPKLSAAALERMRAEAAAGARIYISIVSLVELTYLVEKGRLPIEVLRRLDDYLDRPDSEISVVPLDRDVVRCLREISRDQVPDMPDRIIAATALCLGVPLASRDRRIRVDRLEVVW